MKIIEEINEYKFKVEVNPGGTYLGVYIDGETKGTSSCNVL